MNQQRYTTTTWYYQVVFFIGIVLIIMTQTTTTTNATRLRVINRIDNNKGKEKSVLSPDLITPIVVETRQTIEVDENLEKKVGETRQHVEKVAKESGFKKPITRHPEQQEALDALNNLQNEIKTSSEKENNALDKLVEQQQDVNAMYKPRDLLVNATAYATEHNDTNGREVLKVEGKADEEKFRNTIERIDHTAQMAGAALYKAHVGQDKVVDKTNLAFDALAALTKAKSKDINEMLQEALKYLKLAKQRLNHAKTRNSTLIQRLIKSEGNNAANLYDNDLVKKAFKNVKDGEQVVVRAETSVREAQSALKLAKRTDDGATSAKLSQKELKDVVKVANSLANKANEANIVANQDDLVEAALASKGDIEAAEKLYTQNTDAHEALRGAYKNAVNNEPTVTTVREKTRGKEMKAFMTADAELDAEERAAIALEKTRADFKDVKPKEETFAGDVLEKAQKEATKSPSEVDGFDYHEFKLNHTKYGDPEGFANSVMDELVKRAITDSDTGVLGPLMPQSYRKVEIKNSAAKLPDSSAAVLRAFDVANFARKCLKDDQLQAKKAAETTKLYEQMVVPASDNEPNQRMKVSMCQNIEEEIENKLQADDDILQATKELIAALRYGDQRKVKTKEVEAAVLKASTAVGIAHRDLDKAEKAVTDIMDSAEDQKLWTYRFKEAGAQQKLHKVMLSLATETNTTSKAEEDIIVANYKVAKGKLKRIRAIHAIRKHELKLDDNDPAATLDEPEFGNSTEIMIALHSAENEVAAQKRYMDAFMDTVRLRYESQKQAADLALKKSQALLTVASVHAPGMTGSHDVKASDGAYTGATGGNSNSDATGGGATGGAATGGQYDAGIDSATGVSGDTSSADDAIDETEGTLEGNVAHLNSLNELVEKYKREAQIARKEADVGSNIILSEEASKAEDDKLDSTKSNRKPTSVISQVLPSEGIKAAREVFEQIYQKPMASDKVMETIEK